VTGQIDSEDLIEPYLRLITARGLSKKVIEDRRAVLRRLVRRTGVELVDQTPETMGSFIAALPQAAWSGKIVSHLRLFYEWTVAEGYVSESPVPARNLLGPEAWPFSSEETEVVNAFLRHLRYRGLSEETIAQTTKTLVRLQRAVPIMAATPVLIEAHLDRYSAETGFRSAEFSRLRGFYRWAVRERRAVYNPMDDIERIPDPRRTPRPIDETDLHKALLTATYPVRPMLLLAGWAGLRSGEISRLRAEHLLLDAPSPVVVVLNGKGATDGIIPISPWLEKELRQCRLPQAGWLFPKRSNSEEHRPTPSISGAARDWFAKLEIEATLHQLRHRFATQTYLATGDLQVTQMLLRHRSWSTTICYVAISPLALVDAVALLPTF
jgi:integrase/recombinase XerC